VAGSFGDFFWTGPFPVACAASRGTDLCCSVQAAAQAAPRSRPVPLPFAMPDLPTDQISPVDRYKLLIGSVVPRPIAFVSTIAPEAEAAAGTHNLAPYSFFTAVGANPMTLLFCPANLPDGGEKDSLRNAKPASEGGTGEFVVNVVSHAYRYEMAATGEALPYGDSEFDMAGFTPAPSKVVRAPRLAESPVSFECRTLQVIRLAPGAPGGSNLVLGEVVHVHLAEGLVNDRYHVDADLLDAIGRMGGADYCTTRDRFDLPRGKAALDAVRASRTDLPR